MFLNSFRFLSFQKTENSGKNVFGCVVRKQFSGKAVVLREVFGE